MKTSANKIDKMVKINFIAAICHFYMWNDLMTEKFTNENDRNNLHKDYPYKTFLLIYKKNNNLSA